MPIHWNSTASYFEDLVCFRQLCSHCLDCCCLEVFSLKNARDFKRHRTAQPVKLDAVWNGQRCGLFLTQSINQSVSPPVRQKDGQTIHAAAVAHKTIEGGSEQSGRKAEREKERERKRGKRERDKRAEDIAI